MFPIDVLKRHQLVKSISMTFVLVRVGKERVWGEEDKARTFYEEEKALEIKNNHTLNVVSSVKVQNHCLEA